MNKKGLHTIEQTTPLETNGVLLSTERSGITKTKKTIKSLSTPPSPSATAQDKPRGSRTRRFAK